MTRTRQPARLVNAEWTRLSVSLTFADGFSKKVRLARLGIRPADYNLNTLRVSTTGDRLQVDTLKGETIELDSSTLRSDLDPPYAAALREMLIAMRGSIAELQKGVNKRVRTGRASRDQADTRVRCHLHLDSPS